LILEEGPVKSKRLYSHAAALREYYFAFTESNNSGTEREREKQSELNMGHNEDVCRYFWNYHPSNSNRSEIVPLHS
jgi:hypothetical protein